MKRTILRKAVRASIENNVPVFVEERRRKRQLKQARRAARRQKEEGFAKLAQVWPR